MIKWVNIYEREPDYGTLVLVYYKIKPHKADNKYDIVVSGGKSPFVWGKAPISHWTYLFPPEEEK